MLGVWVAGWGNGCGCCPAAVAMASATHLPYKEALLWRVLFAESCASAV